MDEIDIETQPDPKPQPKSKVDLEQLAELEKALLEKVGKKIEAIKLEEQADAELAQSETSSTSINIEQIFLMIGAAVMIFSLPFMHYLLAIALTLFTIIISLVAGFSSSENPLSPRINLFISLIGLLVFEYSAIIIHDTSGSGSIYWLYQALAFLFLFATFFSARTYRKRISNERSGH